MCPKDFDYESRNSNRAQDNEFYNFKDEFNRVNKVDEFSSNLDVDVLTSGHEYNPYSQEITNPSDDNKTNRAEDTSSSHAENVSNNTGSVKDAAKLQSVTNTTTSLVSNLQSVLLTATVAGGAAIGVVTAVTSPMIDVSLFSRTKEALVFEVETTNIEESDEVIAKLSKGDEVYEIKLEGQRFLNFEDLEENNEYTLEIHLNGDRKFRKNYMTVGPDIPVELTVGEYTRENLVFDVYKPDTYSFVTVTVYSDSKNYLAKDQTTESQHYSVTGINYHENVYLSVTDESGKGLAFSEFAPLPDIPDVTMSEVSESTVISQTSAEIALQVSETVDVTNLTVKLNGVTIANPNIEYNPEQPLNYLMTFEGLSMSTTYELEVYKEGQVNALIRMSFTTLAKADITFSEVSDESRIEAYYAEFGLVASEEIDTSTCSVKVDGSTSSGYYLVADDDQPLHYTLVLEGLDADCSQRVEIYIRGQSNAAFTKTFRTPASTQVSFTKISEVIEKTTVTYVFECNSEFEIDELKFMLNEEEREVAFDADQDNPGRYTLEINGLAANSSYYFDIYLNGQSAKVFSSVFTTKNVIQITDYTVDARVDYTDINLVFDDTPVVEDLVIEIINKNTEELALYEVSQGQSATELLVHAYELAPGTKYQWTISTEGVTLRSEYFDTLTELNFSEYTDDRDIGYNYAKLVINVGGRELIDAEMNDLVFKVNNETLTNVSFVSATTDYARGYYYLELSNLNSNMGYVVGIYNGEGKEYLTIQFNTEKPTDLVIRANNTDASLTEATITYSFSRTPDDDEIGVKINGVIATQGEQYGVEPGQSDNEYIYYFYNLTQGETYTVSIYHVASGWDIETSSFTTQSIAFTELRNEILTDSATFYYECNDSIEPSEIKVYLDEVEIDHFRCIEDTSQEDVYVLSIFNLQEETTYDMRVMLADSVTLVEKTFVTTGNITSASYNQNDSVIGSNSADIVFTFNRCPLEDEITYVVTDASGFDLAVDISVSDGPGDTESKVSITGLTEDTTYMVKAYLTSEGTSGNPLGSAEITTETQTSQLSVSIDTSKGTEGFDIYENSFIVYLEFSRETSANEVEAVVSGADNASIVFDEDNLHATATVDGCESDTDFNFIVQTISGETLMTEVVRTKAEEPDPTGSTFSLTEKSRNVDTQSATIYFECTGECDESKLVIMDNGITQDNSQFSLEDGGDYTLMLYRGDTTVNEHSVTIDYDGTRIYETTITYSDDQQGTTTDLEFRFELDGSGASSTSPLRITYVTGTLPEGGSTGPNINVTVQRDGKQVGSDSIAIDGDQNIFAEIDIDGEEDPTGTNPYTYEGTYTIIMWDINQTEQIYSTEIQLP